MTELPIVGMTCRACEVRVTRALRRVPGVADAHVSAARGTARVRTEGPVDRAALEAAVVAAGYTVATVRRPWLSRDRQTWADVALAAAAFGALAVVARAAGLEGLTGSVGAAALGGDAALVLVLGLVAGVSTCAALVGGLVLTVAARHAERHPDATPRARLVPQLAFAVGRVLGFGVLGAALGAVGSAVRLGAGPVALLTLVVSVAMVLVGLQLTGVSPRLAGVSLALPSGLAARLGLDGPSRYGHLRTAALGAATFLLPCGITQAVQLYALSLGDPLAAGTTLALFALGTAPGLLGIGSLTAAARGPRAPRVLRVAGVAVLGFALVNASGVVTVLAPGLGVARASATTAAALDTERDGDVQVLRTSQTATGYEPARVTVEAGVPLRWEIDSVAPGCASALYAPALGIGTTLLDPGVTVLEVGALTAGTVAYSCAMGMYTGVIDVVEVG